MPIPELPGFDEGAWWVQDAAAALPARLFDVHPGMRIADLCSAPGGKTAQLAARGASVTAIDRSAERLKLLSSNFERLHLEAEIIVADVVALNGPIFDAVLLDAPCSATGTIRRHPDVAWTKKPGDLIKLAAMQSRMLDKAFELVRPGGTIVYCTCSLEPEEGEQQIAALLRRNPDVVRRPLRKKRLAASTNWSMPMARSAPCHFILLIRSRGFRALTVSSSRDSSVTKCAVVSTSRLSASPPMGE